MTLTRARPASRKNKKLTSERSKAEEPVWTFLTNHAHVLLCIAREPEILMRDVAQLVGITERAVQRIVADLELTGYLERVRHGRRNHYKIRTHLALRHPIERHEKVSALIALVYGKGQETLKTTHD